MEPFGLKASLDSASTIGLHEERQRPSRGRRNHTTMLVTFAIAFCLGLRHSTFLVRHSAVRKNSQARPLPRLKPRPLPQVGEVTYSGATDGRAWIHRPHRPADMASRSIVLSLNDTQCWLTKCPGTSQASQHDSGLALDDGPFCPPSGQFQVSSSAWWLSSSLLLFRRPQLCWPYLSRLCASAVAYAIFRGWQHPPRRKDQLYR